MPVPFLLQFLKKLFSKPTHVTCPRCLGKGKVDSEDIKRLKMTGTWCFGSCAYCLREGKVERRMLATVPVNDGFLTGSTIPEIRTALIEGERWIVNDVKELFLNPSHAVLSIMDYYKYDKLGVEAITEKYLADASFSEMEAAEVLEYKRKFTEYVAKVIAFMEKHPIVVDDAEF